MGFRAFWDYVVISDPINCHKATSKKVKTNYYVAKNSIFIIFYDIPEYSEKSGDREIA
jgi:hypothetical protein